MPKLSVQDMEDLDIDELEDADYEESDFIPYDGEQPPSQTVLRGFIRRAWWTRSQENDNHMIVVAFEAKDNEGDEAEYNGWSTLDYMTLTPKTKFRWQPFLNATGLTLRQLKTKIFIEDDEDNVGFPITKIDKWEPGEDNDNAWLRIITKREKYKDEIRAKVGKWLAYEDADEDADEDEDEEEAPPAKTRKAPAKAAAAKAPAARTRRTSRAAPVAEPDTEADDDEDEDEAPAPAKRGATARRGSASRTAGKAKPAARGSSRRPAKDADDDDDEPPF